MACGVADGLFPTSTLRKSSIPFIKADPSTSIRSARSFSCRSASSISVRACSSIRACAEKPSAYTRSATSRKKNKSFITKTVSGGRKSVNGTLPCT